MYYILHMSCVYFDVQCMVPAMCGSTGILQLGFSVLLAVD